MAFNSALVASFVGVIASIIVISYDNLSWRMLRMLLGMFLATLYNPSMFSSIAQSASFYAPIVQPKNVMVLIFGIFILFTMIATAFGEGVEGIPVVLNPLLYAIGVVIWMTFDVVRTSSRKYSIAVGSIFM